MSRNASGTSVNLVQDKAGKSVHYNAHVLWAFLIDQTPFFPECVFHTLEMGKASVNCMQKVFIRIYKQANAQLILLKKLKLNFVWKLKCMIYKHNPERCNSLWRILPPAILLFFTNVPVRIYKAKGSQPAAIMFAFNFSYFPPVKQNKYEKLASLQRA